MLALLATALVILLRRSRKPRYVPTPQGPPAHDPFGRPPAAYMSQAQHLAPGLYGAAKPSTDGGSSAITAASSLAPSRAPTPGPGPGMMRGVHNPPPPEGYDSAVPYGPDYVGIAPYSDTPAAAELGATTRERPLSELPVERGHGELRELA